MKKDSETMKEVAERCTRFDSYNHKSCGCSNSSKEDNISCINCTHYTPDIVCDLDLYREIVDNHSL